MFVDSDGYDNVLYTTRFDDLILIQSSASLMNYEMRKSLNNHLNSKNHVEYLQPQRPALNPFEFPFRNLKLMFLRETIMFDSTSLLILFDQL